MKICDVSSFYSEHGGGVRTYHRQKLAWFARHPEHEYVMIVPGPVNEVSDLHGGRVYHARGFPVSRRAHYRQLADYREIRRILRAERPDVVEVGSAYLDCWLAWAAERRAEVLFAGFYHADFPDCYVAPAVSGLPRALGEPIVEGWRRYAAFVYRRFDVTCVCSRHVEDKLRSYGVTNTLRVPLGVDLRRFRPDRRQDDVRRALGAADDDRLVLFVGRFHPEKELDPVLEAVRRLDGRPRLRFALVGGGPQEEAVRSALSACRSATVLDFVSDPEQLADIYAAADLYLAPGPHETFGLAVLEALASGLPVVAVDHGAAGEFVVDGAAGALFRRGDGADLAGRIEELLARDLPALGRQVRDFAEQRYSWDRTFRRLVGRYEDMVRAKRAGVAIAATSGPAASTSGSRASSSAMRPPNSS